jgi:glycosyltransferase involved in cell wall biosynthesis
MKILFVTLASPRVGKANVDIFHNAARLSEKGHEIHLITRKMPRIHGKQSPEDSITVHRLAFWMPVVSLIFCPIFVLRVIILTGKIQPDVIAAENNLHAPFAGYLAGKFWGIPSAFLLRELTADAIFHDKSQFIIKRWGAWLWMKLTHQLLRRTSNKLAINQGIKDYYEKVLDQSIPSAWLIGYDLEKFSLVDQEIHELRKKFNLVPGCNYLLYAGSLDTHRGLMTVLRAMHELGGGYNLHLLITGEGRGIKKMKHFVSQSNLEDRVSFLDWIDERDMYGLARLAQVGIEPYERLWPQDHTPSTKIALYVAADLFVLARPAPGYKELLQPGVKFDLFENVDELQALLFDIGNGDSTSSIKLNNCNDLVNSKLTSNCLEEFLRSAAGS